MDTQVATRLLPATAEAVEEAAARLRAGGLVAFPTETVYGLGADARDGAAVARLYVAKGRPRFNPLIAHVADIAGARELATLDAQAQRLARAFWPGPLTLVLPKRIGAPVADLATAGLESVAVRVPAHPVARDLLRAFAGPIVAPSANRSGHVSPTEAAHVLADLDRRIDLIIDGGATQVGLESTIVACLGDVPMLLRPGGLPREAIERVLCAGLRVWMEGAGGEVAALAPGQLASHYAPRAQLRLNAIDVAPNEALLAFGPALPPGAERAQRVLTLSASGDLIEAATNLFSHLRSLDGNGVATIAVMPIPFTGLGEAINDRLRRAAAPRCDIPSEVHFLRSSQN
ncbi:MAG TPA: L-threonylcarbamoyladenylate synthase [Xanthobacteraceae bacterium]|nr:L-threonylcarbamoyladenylate synthase [Xanthobacteraceae bacterium]